MRFGAVRTRPGANTVPPRGGGCVSSARRAKIRFFFGLCFRNTGSSGAVRPKRLRLSGSAVRTVRSLYREDKGLSGRPNAPVACGFDPSGGRGRFPGLRGLRGFRDDSGICYLCLDMYSYAKAPPIRLSKKVHRKLIFSLLLLLAAAVVVSRCMVSAHGRRRVGRARVASAEKADGMPSVRGGCLIREDRAPDWSCRLVRAASF